MLMLYAAEELHSLNTRFRNPNIGLIEWRIKQLQKLFQEPQKKLAYGLSLLLGLLGMFLEGGSGLIEYQVKITPGSPRKGRRTA